MVRSIERERRERRRVRPHHGQERWRGALQSDCNFPVVTRFRAATVDVVVLHRHHHHHRNTLQSSSKMLSRSASIVARTVLPRTLARSFAAEASSTVDATSVILNFSVPYESIYKGVPVAQVIIPGVEGEYGVTANHVPYVAQMKPGVLQILFDDGSEAEKYFVAGGYALTHANSVTVSTPCCCIVLIEWINGRTVYHSMIFYNGLLNQSLCSCLFFCYGCVTHWSQFHIHSFVRMLSVLKQSS